jgi:hypothetical protein
MADEDWKDCIETREDLVAKLVQVEREMATQHGIKGDVRQEILRRIRAGEIVEDELLVRWHELYAGYLGWEEDGGP